MLEYGFSLTRIFLYKNGIADSVLIQENTRQRKPVFWHVLSSAWEYWILLKSWAKLCVFRFPLRQIETRNICKVQFFIPSILFLEYFYHFSVSRCWALSRHIFLSIILLPISDKNILNSCDMFWMAMPKGTWLDWGCGILRSATASQTFLVVLIFSCV